MNNWQILAEEETLNKTITALKDRNIEALVVKTGEDAKRKFLEMVPGGSEVMNVTSTTVEQIGLAKEINESGRYDSVKNKLNKLSRETDNKQMQMIGGAPEWVVGSVHAVTEDGQVLDASNSGSQLGAYAYGAEHVVWIVGTHKIVKNTDEGFKRIYEYVLPLESERSRKAYGSTGSNVSKVLIINKEKKPGRITLIFVKEVLGF